MELEPGGYAHQCGECCHWAFMFADNYGCMGSCDRRPNEIVKSGQVCAGFELAKWIKVVDTKWANAERAKKEGGLIAQAPSQP